MGPFKVHAALIGWISKMFLVDKNSESNINTVEGSGRDSYCGVHR